MESSLFLVASRSLLMAAALGSSLLLMVDRAAALPVEWTTASGGNGHTYEVVELPRITWETASSAAQGAGGYLVTITSAAEQSFLDSVVRDSSLSSLWAGGLQSPPSSNPAANWVWVTGETWSFTNWLAGEPNDDVGDESNLVVYGGGGRVVGTWNDEGNVRNIQGYIIETDATTTTTTTSIQPPITTTTTGGCSTIPDADTDGEPDPVDKCPATPSGVPVDEAGCSQAEFCARFDATSRGGAGTCKVADWKNDEPVMRPRDRDCTVDKGGRGRADDRCVPAQ